MAYSSLLPTSLRWHPEPGIAVSDYEVHERLMADPAGYLNFLAGRLEAIGAGKLQVTMPAKQIFDDPGGGDFRVMPCAVRGRDAVFKTVKIVGTNVAGHLVPDQVTVGKALVVHSIENYVTHVVDACLLSSARTGACAALAARALGASPQSVALIGAGRVAYYAACFLAESWPSAQFYIVDSVPNRAEVLSRDLGDRGLEARAVTDDHWPKSDLIVLATTSCVPVLTPHVSGLAKVVSLGADTAWQRELDDAWAAEPLILTDTLDSLRVGDLFAWQAAGRPLPEVEVFFRRNESAAYSPRLFISTGSALFDNLTLEFLVLDD